MSVDVQYYRPALTDRETERNWDLDLAEDIKGEVESKYGTVKRIKVDKMSAVRSIPLPENYTLTQGRCVH